MKLLGKTGLLIGLLICFSSSLHAQQVNEFTLQNCIDYALKNNEDIRVSEMEKKRADGTVGETRAQGLPQINASATLTNNYKVPTSFIPAIFFDPNAGEGEFAPVQFGTQYTGNAGITLDQMIFDGSYFVGLEAARTFRELSTKDHIRTQIDVIANVTKAYYTVLVNQEQLSFVEKNFQRLDTLLNETDIMYQNGFAEKIDVNRIRIQYNNSKIQRKKLQDFQDISLKLLKFQMGMSANESLSVTGNLDDVELSLNELEVVDFDYKQRIEYSQLETNQALARLDMKNNKVQYLPTIDFFAQIGKNAGTTTSSDLFKFGDNWFGNGAFGATIKLPIFDGLRKSYGIQKSKIQIAQIDLQKQRLKNSIDVEIYQARTNLNNNLVNLETQKENLTLAEEVYRVSKIKYQEGVGSNLEVIDAEIAYKSAETDYYNAVYDALISKVDLDKAYGRLFEQN
ncbi:TolC family protein [Fulvivirgaceae bacterium BMA10]|uniref:TolC family protein n=1 Tax=Splendidivirga corallicola TaxID=3051826 RepID=A0ABT8KQD7_9BACT|nr:TolC family protein [Fulvivirgaceae bacterium BMA10]